MSQALYHNLIDAKCSKELSKPLPEDAPFFVKDYYDYYKTERGYHPRSLNSNDGWTVNTIEPGMYIA